MSFLEFISRVKGNLGNYPTEQDVSQKIVLPVLRYLGWETEGLGYVYPEYSLGNAKSRVRVDFGLKISKKENEDLQCIIEVKSEKKLKIGCDEEQLFKYAFIAGVPLAVLTNGKLWMFYLPMKPGKIEKRLFRTLDFENHKSEGIIESLNQYLSFKNTCSGRAVRNAERDYKEKIKRKEAKKNIRVAWKKLLDGSSEKLITLLIEEASQIHPKYVPARMDVVNFLKDPDNFEVYPKTSLKAEPKTPKPRETRKEEDISFFLLDNKYSDNLNVASAFAKILEVLAKRDQCFLTQLAEKTVGKKYPLLSQNQKDLTPLSPKSRKKLPNGWWVSTHSSTYSKKVILKKACEVAGIPFGKSSGLKVNF